MSSVISNERGNTLVTVLMAAAIGAIVAAVSMQTMKNMMGAQKYIEQKSAIVYATNDLYTLLSDPKSCTQTFKGLRRSDLAGKAFNVKEIKDGAGKTIFERHSIGNKTYDGGDVKIDDMTVLEYAPSPIVGTERNNGRAKLQVGFQRSQQAMGPSFRPKTITVDFTFRRDKAHGGMNEDDGHDDEIFSCSATGSTSATTLQVALGVRRGISLELVGCEEKVDSKDYNGDPHCADRNLNSLCDDRRPDGGRYAKIPHPWVDPDSEYHKKFEELMFDKPAHPKATAGKEGRCNVYLIDKPDGTVASDIFIVYDKGTRSGLGCQRANGWQLANCSLSYFGLSGDSDVNVQVSPSGDQYCDTNDFTQPHSNGEAWNTKQVNLSVSCMRIQQQQ